MVEHGKRAGAKALDNREGNFVNDVHSRLNPTVVREVGRPRSIEELQAVVRRAGAEGLGVSAAGGRHAMGGQQFATGAVLVDMSALNRVIELDAERGHAEVEAGVQWPELIAYLIEAQVGRPEQWGIAQKQTGADRLSIGGALAANVHGRGLMMRPFVSDIEAFTLVDAEGEARRCSRTENADFFRLAAGGYGLFGIAATVRLRLTPRRRVRRIVEVCEVADVITGFERRIEEGYLYGDFQFSVDTWGDDFLSRGVFSCYHPVNASTPIPEGQKSLTSGEWKELLYLAHADKRRVVDLYTEHYLASSGQVYWSDTHQLAEYADGYHEELDRRLRAAHPATEMITELYVPREALASFMESARRLCREQNADVVYGTVRLIERDDESFLAWAREPWACVIFNLHTEHTPDGLARSAATFRGLIDLAIQHGGSYYLTYHRWASREQVEACYPQFEEFLRLKLRHDPSERFQSDWYRHHQALFA